MTRLYPYLLLTAVCVVAALAVVTASDSKTPTARASSTSTGPAIAGRYALRTIEARDKARACQARLGLEPSPVSTKPVLGPAYARWVLTLWRARAQAYCSVARALTDTGVLRNIINPCLATIVDRETAGTWSPTVYNYAGSGAYGLPQALPGSKMASAGPDWRTNPLVQLKWMAKYVRDRYGSACGALAFHARNGWY